MKDTNKKMKDTNNNKEQLALTKDQVGQVHGRRRHG